MAKVQTTYTSSQAVTLATRADAYDLLARLVEHLDHLNINLISVIVNPDHTVSITLDDAVPPSQQAHLLLP